MQYHFILGQCWASATDVGCRSGETWSSWSAEDVTSWMRGQMSNICSVVCPNILSYTHVRIHLILHPSQLLLCVRSLWITRARMRLHFRKPWPSSLSTPHGQKHPRGQDGSTRLVPCHGLADRHPGGDNCYCAGHLLRALLHRRQDLAAAQPVLLPPIQRS